MLKVKARRKTPTSRPKYKRGGGIVTPYCNYCKGPLKPARNGKKHTSLSQTRDHLFPQSKGGKFTVSCCHACNTLKADMLPEEWYEFTLKNPHWWKLWKPKPVPHRLKCKNQNVKQLVE